MRPLVEYEVGDVVEYENYAMQRRHVCVDERESDIKNGQPGFGGFVTGGPDDGLECWGYDHQIVRVVSKADPLSRSARALDQGQ